MFKTGDKAKGFKFDSDTDSVHYDNEMDDYVDMVGEVVEVYSHSFVIMFPDHLEWMYPASLWHHAKMEEDISAFKVGDKVKFKKSSLATGMVDATEDDVFEIGMTIGSRPHHVRLLEMGLPGNLGSTWSINHFEHVKEEIMEEHVVENQAIDWEVGQEVWDLILGKGFVFAVHNELTRTFACQPIVVKFDSGELSDYSVEGVSNIPVLKSLAHKRTLFFSEPKIEAELFPPKKPFVPVLKEGVDVFIKTKSGVFSEGVVRTVYKETEDRIFTSEDGHYFLKRDIESIRVLSEQVKFS